MGRDPLVLVTGAGGQVGTALASHFPSARLLDSRQLDVTDRDAVTAAVQGVDLVAHCAALTDLPRCEADPDAAERVNASGTENVVGAASDVGAPVVYISTDYVFDGAKIGCYREDDEPGPLNVYGATKLRGEEHVSEAGGTIIRTSWVYGAGRNFIASILRAAVDRDEIEVVDDQLGRPTSAEDVALAIHHAIREGVRGVVHLSGDGPPASWADVAQRALEAVESPTRVRRISTVDFDSRVAPPVVSRPPNSLLCLDRAVELGFRLRDWRTSVDGYAKGAR